LDEELGHFDWLEPAAREVFGGKYDPNKVNRLVRASMRDFQAADLRDWQAIEAWGMSLAEMFSENKPE
jgi:menaquinone-dependent protoporphyrinogen IX oxidase